VLHVATCRWSRHRDARTKQDSGGRGGEIGHGALTRRRYAYARTRTTDALRTIREVDYPEAAARKKGFGPANRGPVTGQPRMATRVAFCGSSGAEDRVTKRCGLFDVPTGRNG